MDISLIYLTDTVYRNFAMKLDCLLYVFLAVLPLCTTQCCDHGILNNAVCINGKCFECPIGLYGVNCSLACPKGWFGSGCKLLCNCTLTEFCHPMEGCVILAPNGSILSKDEDNGTNNRIIPSAKHPIVQHFYGLTIKQWFWTSVCFLTTLVISIMVMSCICTQRNKDKEYQPKQILDILSAFSRIGTENSTLPTSGQNHLQEESNGYRMEDYSEVDYRSVRSQSLSAQRRFSNNYEMDDRSNIPSNNSAEGGVVNNYSVAQAPPCTMLSQADTFKTGNDELGYNSLTLRSNASNVNGSYAETIASGTAGIQFYHFNRKSVMNPVMRFGGRISQFFADRFVGPNGNPV